MLLVWKENHSFIQGTYQLAETLSFIHSLMAQAQHEWRVVLLCNVSESRLHPLQAASK